jgi:hypothetical protein
VGKTGQLRSVVPEELGPAPDDISVHDRCNRWILYIALSHRLSAQ